MEYYIFLWEISGRVRLGFSYDPSADLREFEASVGARASKVLRIRVNVKSTQTAQMMLGHGRAPAYIPLDFQSAKDTLLAFEPGKM